MRVPRLHAAMIAAAIVMGLAAPSRLAADEYSKFHAQRVLAVAKGGFAQSDLHPSLWNGGPTVSSYLVIHPRATLGLARNPSAATMVTEGGESRLSAQTQLLINEVILAGETETFNTTVLRAVSVTLVEASGATPPAGDWKLLSWTESAIPRRYPPDFELPTNLDDAVTSISLFTTAGTPPDPFSDDGNRHRALLGFALDALSVEDNYLEAAYDLSRSPCIRSMPMECQLLGLCLFRAGKWESARSWILRGREKADLTDPRETAIVTYCEQMMEQ